MSETKFCTHVKQQPSWLFWCCTRHACYMPGHLIHLLSIALVKFDNVIILHTHTFTHSNIHPPNQACQLHRWVEVFRSLDGPPCATLVLCSCGTNSHPCHWFMFGCDDKIGGKCWHVHLLVGFGTTRIQDVPRSTGRTCNHTLTPASRRLDLRREDTATGAGTLLQATQAHRGVEV
jgi:hypothetical protein